MTGSQQGHSARDHLRAEVARLSADGMTQAQISSELGISQPTVHRVLSELREIRTENLQHDAVYATAQTLTRRDGDLGLPMLPAPDRDVLGRALCTVEDCALPREYPLEVCDDHAGSPEARNGARIALLDLVNPAIRRLGELVHSRDERVALAASNSILDRTGHHARAEIQVTDVREVLLERMLAARQAYLNAHPQPEVLEGEVMDEVTDLI